MQRTRCKHQTFGLSCERAKSTPSPQGLRHPNHPQMLRFQCCPFHVLHLCIVSCFSYAENNFFAFVVKQVDYCYCFLPLFSVGVLVQHFYVVCNFFFFFCFGKFAPCRENFLHYFDVRLVHFLFEKLRISLSSVVESKLNYPVAQFLPV